MTTTTPPPPPPPPPNKEGLQTEAKELEQDIKETQAEAQAERDAGNIARAERLEQSLTETKSELAEIKTTLKQLVDRPFAPAPGDGEPATPPAGETPPEGTPEGTAPEGAGETPPPPAGKKHWLFGNRWNEE